ncbi:hypothetical protein X474_02180 [Dethiosulfatarculus sandiegensis]|uniref:Uncharacterized protein n=1 Tax=Dethiosulfatarculus sandiegensis TaxID=1429043 RepID=A0A0D2GLV5_9BACT|nr:hypothetical protein X474_02180 [Dethiosulfatarculus sandiegensis]
MARVQAVYQQPDCSHYLEKIRLYNLQNHTTIEKPSNLPPK